MTGGGTGANTDSTVSVSDLTMKITEQFEKALAFAVQLHRHQFRKGG